MSVDQMSVGQMSVGQMSVGQMSVGQTTLIPIKCMLKIEGINSLGGFENSPIQGILTEGEGSVQYS
jgi:hypothetical protein